MENPSLQIGDNNWAVKDGSILGYNIIQDNYLPQPIDFTRASTATRVNAEGLIEGASILGSELITNGSFATDTDWTKGTGWTISGGEANFNTTANAFLSQSGSYVGGKTYKVLIDVVSYTRGNPFIAIGQGSQFNIPTTIGSHTLYVVSGGVDTLLRIYSGIFGVGGQGSIDNVSIKEVITNNVPRIDYTGGGFGKLLLEPQRTNLVVNSTNNLTSLGGGVVDNSAGISPSGDVDAQKVTFGASPNDGASLGINASVSSSTDYILTFYAKSVVGDGTFKVRVDTNTTIGIVQPTITATSEWVRYEILITTGGTDNAIASTSRLRPSTALNEVLFWGFDLEQGSYPTSYIPTSGTAVTRLADAAFKTGISSLINSTEGVLYVECSVLDFATTNSWISISEDANYNNNQFNLRFVENSNLIQVVSRAGGLGQDVVLNYTLTDKTALNKIAIKYKLNDWALWVNGVEVDTETSSIPFTANSLDVLDFNRGNNSNYFYGNVQNLMIFPSALSDTELATLTTI